MSDASNTVKCFVPNESSVIVDTNGHTHLVAIDDDGKRYVMLTVGAIKGFLESGLACSLPWRSANQHLLGGVLGPVEKPEPGINLVRLQMANAAAAPRDPRDRGGHARDVLQQTMGRLPK
jgi:hypothetical protein